MAGPHFLLNRVRGATSPELRNFKIGSLALRISRAPDSDAFEVAAEVTAVAPMPVSRGSSGGFSANPSKTPVPVSLRTPPPVTVRRESAEGGS